MAQHYDVIATEIKTGNMRVIAQNQTEENAKTIVKITVMRMRGVTDEFFSIRARPPASPAVTQQMIEAGISAYGSDDDRPTAARVLDIWIAMYNKRGQGHD